MGLMDFFIRPEPISYGTAKGLNTLQINRIAADLRTARDKVNNQMAKRELLEKQREAAVKVKTEAEEQLGVFGLVQILLQKTSDYARQQVKVRIEDIVSEALNVVFGGNHKFMIDLTLRGNQPIAEYYLNDDSVITKLEKPDYDRGGGKIDIIALALRLAVGEMEGVDGPLFLDEVGKHVSKEYAPSVAYFLKEYSATFGRQIILITHNADLAEIGEVSLAVKRSQSGESEVYVRDRHVCCSCSVEGTYHIDNDDMEPLFTVLFDMITDGILEKAEV